MLERVELHPAAISLPDVPRAEQIQLFNTALDLLEGTAPAMDIVNRVQLVHESEEIEILEIMLVARTGVPSGTSQAGFVAMAVMETGTIPGINRPSGGKRSLAKHRVNTRLFENCDRSPAPEIRLLSPLQIHPSCSRGFPRQTPMPR